jgi:TatD DNase family protein
MFVDTHAHLYARQFDDDRAAMLARAITGGVEKFFLPNIDVDSIAGMNALAAAHPDRCFPMMGLHPCSVGERNAEVMAVMERELRTGRYCAVGEIGIDLYWDKTWLVQQQEVFRQHIRWAKELRLPVVIHCRNSFEETITIVEEESLGASGTADLRGVFHCFGGTVEEGRRILALDGFVLGIGGVITYPKSGLAQVMAELGPERCVLETDAPYLAPVPHRGKRNESGYIPLVAAELAKATGRSVEEIARITTSNALNLFGR